MKINFVLDGVAQLIANWEQVPRRGDEVSFQSHEVAALPAQRYKAVDVVWNAVLHPQQRNDDMLGVMLLDVVTVYLESLSEIKRTE
jgi:hypothetical protein